MSLVEKYVCPRSDTAVPSPGLSTGNSTSTLKPGRCASESCPPLEDVAAKTSGRTLPRCTSSRCGARRMPSRALWPSLDPSPPEGPPLCPTIKAGKEGDPIQTMHGIEEIGRKERVQKRVDAVLRGWGRLGESEENPTTWQHKFAGLFSTMRWGSL